MYSYALRSMEEMLLMLFFMSVILFVISPLMLLMAWFLRLSWVLPDCILLAASQFCISIISLRVSWVSGCSLQAKC